jgi:HlyD family secretion protein
MKKIIFILVLIGVGAAGYFGYQEYSKRQQADAISSLQTSTTSKGDLKAKIGATGIVRSNQSAQLNWSTSGTVEEIHVDVGDHVTSGMVLANLQQTSLPQNVILAQADLANAEKSLEDLYDNAIASKTEAIKAISLHTKSVRDAQYTMDNYTIPSNQADLDTIEALNLMEERLDKARQAFEPYRYLSANNDTRQDLLADLNEAQSDFDSAVRRLEIEYELEVAKENLAKAKADLETWIDGPDPADIAAAEARIAAAQAALKSAWIEAPFDGRITAANPKPGDQVEPNMQAFRLDDLSRLLLDVQVSEVDINRIQTGQEAILSFDAILDEEYHGVVTEVAPVGTSDLGVVDFTVTVELNDADENIKPGMTAAVNIVVENLEDVLLVPNRAVRFKDGERIVYTLVEGELTPIAVTLGSTSESTSEVIDGELKVGDIVVLNPPVEFEQNGPPGFAR